MNENELLDWLFFNVDGDTLKEWSILKIALCRSFQQQYSDIESMCKNAGVSYAAEDVRKWKQNNKQVDTYILDTLYDYLVYQERERFLKSANLYYKQNS